MHGKAQLALADAHNVPSPDAMLPLLDVLSSSGLAKGVVSYHSIKDMACLRLASRHSRIWTDRHLRTDLVVFNLHRELEVMGISETRPAECGDEAHVDALAPPRKGFRT